MHKINFKKLSQRGLLLVVGLFILIAIFWHKPLELSQVKALLLSPRLVAINAGLCLITLLLGALRWVVIARSLGVPLGFWRATKASFVGGFIGTFLPTAAGADVGRFGLCFLDSQQKWVGALSIFFDRAWGVASLLIVVGGSSLIENSLGLDIGTRSVFLAVGVSALILTGGSQFALGHERFQGFLAQWGMAGIRAPSVTHYLTCFVLGVLNTIGNCLIFKYNAEALGIQSMIWPYLAIVPIGALGTALSFIPFGLGVSQVLFHELFRFAGLGLPAQGIVVASMAQAYNFGFHLLAVVFVFKKTKPQALAVPERRAA